MDMVGRGFNLSEGILFPAHHGSFEQWVHENLTLVELSAITGFEEHSRTEA